MEQILKIWKNICNFVRQSYAKNVNSAFLLNILIMLKKMCKQINSVNKVYQ